MKPQIFISAVSAEFLEIRKQVALILSGLGYEPIVQEVFTTASGDLREMHKSKIDSCDGLIQIVGDAYGYEPPDPDPEFGRCSFTQFEYFYAKQQKKEVWVIHAQQACNTSAEVSQLDLPPPEENLSKEKTIAYQKERRDLQIAYRQRLEAEGQIVHAVNSDDALALKLNSLKDELAHLSGKFKKWQKSVVGMLSAVVFLLIAGGIYFANTVKEQQKGIDQIVTEVKKPAKEWDIEDYRAGLMKVARQTHAEDMKKVDAISDWEKRLEEKKKAEERHVKRLEIVEAAINTAQEGYLSGNISETTLEFNRIVRDQGLDEALEFYERVGKEDERKDVEALVQNQQKELKIKLAAALAAANGYYLKGNLKNTVERCEFILNYHPGWNDVWHLGYLVHFDLTTKLLSSRGPEAARIHAEKSHRYATFYAKNEPHNQTALRDLSVSFEKLGDILLQEGNIQEARRQYEQSLTIHKNLASAGKTPQSQCDLCVSYDNLGDIFLLEGNIKEAQRQYEESLKIRKELASADKTDAQAQRNLSLSYENLGFIFQREGNISEARFQYEQSLKIAKKLASDDKTITQPQRDLSIAYNNLGDILLQEGNIKEAQRQYEESLKIRRELASAGKTNVLAQRDITVSYNKLGDLSVKKGNLPEARKLYEQSLTILKKLASADKTNAHVQADLSFSYEKLGNVFMREGNLPKARSQYEQSIKIYKELASIDKTNASGQHDISVSYIKLGEIFLLEGNLSEARSQFKQSLKIAKDLASADETNVKFTRILSISYIKLGDIFLQEGNLLEARSQYEQGLTIQKKIASTDETDAQAQRDLSSAYYRLGDIFLREGNLPKARSQYEQSIKIYKELASIDKTNAQAQRDLSVLHNRLGDIFLQEGNIPDAGSQYEQSLTIRKNLASANKTNAQTQLDLMFSNYKVGKLLAISEETRKVGVAHFQAALDILLNLERSNRLRPDAKSMIKELEGLIEKYTKD